MIIRRLHNLKQTPPQAGSTYTGGLQLQSSLSKELTVGAYTATLQTATPKSKVLNAIATGVSQATSPEYRLGTGDPGITPDPGAGQWNSRIRTWEVMLKKELILDVLPLAWVAIGDDATKHMVHYLGNTGSDLTIDLQGMINDISSARMRMVDEILQAQHFVLQLPPGRHNITSKRLNVAYAQKSESWNWFYATGGYSTWGTGVASISEGKSGDHYTLDFEYHYYDRYNWDKGKSVTIGGVKIEDDTMGEFHRQGLAREFDMRGSIKRQYSWTGKTGFPSDLNITTGR